MDKKRTKKDFVKQGKRNKRLGADFERRTRKDLESKGWIVSKWQNNVEFDNNLPDKYYESLIVPWTEIPKKELDKKKKGFIGMYQGNEIYESGKCVQAKPGRFRMMQTGFPDFIAYKLQIIKKNKPIFFKIDTDNPKDIKKLREDIEETYKRQEIFMCGKEVEIIDKTETDIIFVECKTNGYLSKEEKEKALFYISNNYCSKFLIASKYKEKGRVKIKYEEFKKD